MDKLAALPGVTPGRQQAVNIFERVFEAFLMIRFMSRRPAWKRDKPEMARILAISDVELGQLYNASIRDRHQGIDLVLSLGDLPMYYLDYISSALNVPLYYVLGNHHADSKRQEASYGRGPAD